MSRLIIMILVSHVNCKIDRFCYWLFRVRLAIFLKFTTLMKIISNHHLISFGSNIITIQCLFQLTLSLLIRLRAICWCIIKPFLGFEQELLIFELQMALQSKFSPKRWFELDLSLSLVNNPEIKHVITRLSPILILNYASS